MSRRSNEGSGSWGRRKSGLFALTSLSSSSEAPTKKTLKKKGGGVDAAVPNTPPIDADMPPVSASSTNDSFSRIRKRSLRRPSSVFGSLKGSRTNVNDQSNDTDEPLSATSSHASTSFATGDATMDGITPSRNVLLYGEVQISGGLLRKKREYVVLSDRHLHRFKNQVKAHEVFDNVPHPVAGRPVRHASMPSAGSSNDLQTLASDSSGEKDGRIALRHVVAVHRPDEVKPYFAVEVCHLDEETGQAAALALQFSNPEERDLWLQNIRFAANEARLRNNVAIGRHNLENAARIVERDNDYDPENCAIFKVVQRQGLKSSGRSSTDDLSKVASNVCFLIIGVHKVHVIQLVKAVAKTGSPSLAPTASQSSYGILTLTAVKVNRSDDTFELSFRQPLQRPRHLYLASLASHEIAARLYAAENFLRPESTERTFKWNVPPEVEDLIPPPAPSDLQEHACLDRTLIAYCIAYCVNPSNVRYTIHYNCEDAPRFELLPPADTRRQEYGPLDCLAIMRALRYNETFGSISFAGIQLDSLNGLHDNYGFEHVCSKTKAGTPIKLSEGDLGRSCLLVQETRALAATSKKLRRMDFSNCVSPKPAAVADGGEDDHATRKDIGSGVVEALFPLCRHQTTNVDWICLNGIGLTDTDMDYLVGAAVEKSCHFRAIELNRCGVTDRSMGLILDALRAQDNTLEAIAVAGNTARLNPVTFDGQLGIFGFIRKLNLSYISRTSGNEPLLQAETLLIWRLEELRLSGTPLNTATVEALATYLASTRSDTLHELSVDHCYLSGEDVALLLQSMTRDPYSLGAGRDEPRQMHFDISQNNLPKGLNAVLKCLKSGDAPTHLSMRAVEYKDETHFRKMLGALTMNKTIQYLDLSQTALPGDASPDTCLALEKLLAENDQLIELDLSGEDSRLATNRFGIGINTALLGLGQNKTMHSFRIEKQRLGLQGSSTLAEVLKINNTLRELHCDDNEIPLQGLTDLVNSLIENQSLVHLPPMNDGRAAAFRSAEATMRGMSDLPSSPVRSPRSPPPSRSSGSNRKSTTPSFTTSSATMRRGLASVRKTASAYTPSLPSSNRSSPVSTSSSPFKPPARPRRQSTSSPLSSFNLSIPSTGPIRRASRLSPEPPVASPAAMAFTPQDIRTTHLLLTEQWDRQVARLQQYLDRNWCLLHDLDQDPHLDPLNGNAGFGLGTEDEAEGRWDRPESVGSLGKVLAQVKFDTTPRAERDLYFDGSTAAEAEAGADVEAEREQRDSGVEVERQKRSRESQRSEGVVRDEGFRRWLLASEESGEESDSGSPEEERAMRVQRESGLGMGYDGRRKLRLTIDTLGDGGNGYPYSGSSSAGVSAREGEATTPKQGTFSMD